ncbi:MAG: helix-turn-helix transcriptional regulator [Solirubrobacteraceae bacterium]
MERAGELDAIGGVVEGAARRSGGVCLVEGVGGVGKTSLLRAGCALAPRGTGILQARGRELEHGFAFGVVRELLAGRVRSLSEKGRQELLVGASALAAPVVGFGDPGEVAEPGFAVLHGLYWLIAGLAEAGPLLLVVDDAQWADRESLLFAAFLAPRLQELPVALLVAAREDVGGGARESLEAIAGVPGARRVRPRALSESAVGELVRHRVGQADAAFVVACHHAVGGNPFLLDQLIAELAAEGIDATAVQAPRIAGLTPLTVTRSIVGRLGAMPHAAGEIARAVAVLGEDAEVRHAVALAGLTLEQAGPGADQLVAASILSPGNRLSFVHPIVREVVYADIGPRARALAHARAAQLLRDDGAAIERVSVHLLSSDPSGDPVVVETLQTASREALARGATDPAIAFLRRALDEPPDSACRAGLLAELGAAELIAADPVGVEHLGEALELTVDPVGRARLALELARAFVVVGRLAEIDGLLARAVAELGDADPELTLLVKGERAVHGSNLPPGCTALRALEPLAEGLTGETPAERQVLAGLANLQALDPGTAAEVVRLAGLGLSDGQMVAEHGPASPALVYVIFGVIFAEGFDVAEREIERVRAAATRAGSVIGSAWAAILSSALAYRRGDLLQAEEYARESVLAFSPGGLSPPLILALRGLVDVLVEREQLDEAVTELTAAGANGELPPMLVSAWLLASRGRLRLACGEAESGLQDLLETGSQSLALNIRNPAACPWRSEAAIAELRLGRRDQGLQLVEEELEIARTFGAPRAIGIAQRAAGLVYGGERGIALLEASVATLEGSAARLEHARALVDLGAALRRSNRRSDARAALAQGIDLARGCGATALVERGGLELAATGARPRTLAFSGVDALTASERRIARLASDGVSNREIAQSLFITNGTVESHLHRVYQKLDIRSRTDLPAALGRAVVGLAGETSG